MENTENSKVMNFINKYNLPVVKIDESRNYWLVRTKAGKYFEEFFSEDFIAVGWNEFSNMDDLENKPDEVLKTQIKEIYPDKEQPGRILNQIKRFLFEIKPGDIVMIPSQNSSLIRFGQITGEPFLRNVSETQIDEGVCPYKKSRHVKWLKTVKRYDLDPYLYRMMQAHQTVSKANDYAHFIDRTLHSFFIKNNTAYIVFDITKDDNIAAFDLVNFVNSIVDLVPLVNDLKGIENEKNYTKADLDLKLNIQSPGFTEFSSYLPELILGICLLIVFLTGSKFKGTNLKGEDYEAHFKGLFEDKLKIEEKDLKEMKEEHIRTLEKVKGELPEELKKFIDTNDQED